MLLTVDPSTEAADTSATASPTGVWLLDTSVEVTNGVTFEIKGTAIGGDCDEVHVCVVWRVWIKASASWVLMFAPSRVRLSTWWRQVFVRLCLSVWPLMSTSFFGSSASPPQKKKKKVSAKDEEWEDVSFLFPFERAYLDKR